MKIQAFFLSAIALLLTACQSNISDTAAQSAQLLADEKAKFSDHYLIHYTFTPKNNLKKFSVFPKPQFNFYGFFVRKKG